LLKVYLQKEGYQLWEVVLDLLETIGTDWEIREGRGMALQDLHMG